MTITRERQPHPSEWGTGGAVTHVGVTAPAGGYGIVLGNMLEAAEERKQGRLRKKASFGIIWRGE